MKECVPSPLSEARRCYKGGQNDQENPTFRRDEAQNSRGSGGRSQRATVHERLEDRAQNKQGPRNSNPCTPSGATQDFDL